MNNVVTCTLCGGATAFWRSKESYKIYRCTDPRCGHGSVSPMPTASELAAFYATATDTLENSGSWTMAKDYERNPQLVHQFYDRSRIRLLRRLGLLTNIQDSVLDLGSSTGMFLRILQDRGFTSLVGQELSTEQADYCRLAHGIKMVTSIRDLPDCSINTVTAYAVIEHIPDAGEVLAEVFRVLTPGGHVAIDVPNTKSFYEWVSRSTWLWLIPPAHLQYFTFQSLQLILEKQGFKIRFAKTMSTSSYIFIIAYHISRLAHRTLPDTSLTDNWIRRHLIWAVEKLIRVFLSPVSALATLLNRHNQLIFVAQKPR